MKPLISHYYAYSHTNRSTESTTWSRSSVFSECPCFYHSVNLDQCQIILTYFVKISSNFILKLVNMFSLLNTDCRVDLPNFFLIPLYSIIADTGLEYIYKHQNLATVNPSDLLISPYCKCSKDNLSNICH